MRRARWLLVPLILSVTSGTAYAQVSTQTVASLDGKIISAIAITPLDPSSLEVPSILRWPARILGVLHTATKAEVIDRFLLLEVGQRYTERHRAESERILRLQPFLAEATVRAVPDTAGGVRIEVETVDEFSTVLQMRFRGMNLSSIRIGSGNVSGQGLYLAASVERGSAYRPGVGVYGTAYQVFGRPYTLAFAAHRAPLGGKLTVALGYPFITEFQRSAWHMGHGTVKDFMPFVRPEGDPLSLSIQRRFWDLGAVRRIGLGSPIAYVGALLTGEDVIPADRAVVVSDSGLVQDMSNALGGPFPTYHNLRVNAVIGVRALSFIPVRGFDTLKAVQDVATGLEVGILAGQGIPLFGTNDDYLFVATDLYAGIGSARSFAALQVKGEGRQDQRADRWHSIVAHGRLAWYWKTSDARVLISSVEYAGGWRMRVPFQLRLGDLQGGVRGHTDSRIVGAVRGAARIEERWLIGGLTRHGAIGFATFADAGRVWAGDVPFGVDSGMKVGVGMGLLAAFPPQSQRLWRLDVAVPVSRDAHAGWEVRLTGIWSRAFWREPNDVAHGRAGASPSTIFIWR